MLGLGFLSSGFGSSSPSKEDQKALELKEKEAVKEREEADRALDARKREFANEAGDPKADKEKESKPKFITLEERHARRVAEQVEHDEGADGHQQHVLRRWAVRLWNFQLESLVKDEGMVFVNINWGGDREESRIKTGEGHRWWQFLSDTEVVWGMGSEPYCLRTDVEQLKEKGKINFKNEFRFEWNGSYADLESQYIGIEVWRWNKFRANTMDSWHKASLVSYATGPVIQRISLVKAKIAKQDGGFVFSTSEKTTDELPRFEASFQLYFQEIYDFDLHVIDVQAVGLLGHSQLSEASPEDFPKLARQLTATTSAVGDGSSAAGATTLSIFDASDSSEEEEDEDEKTKQQQAVKAASKGFRKAKRRVQLDIENRSFMQSLGRGEMSIKSDLKKIQRAHVTVDRWGNVGSLHYRGTLADLDNDLLRLKIFETNLLSPLPTLIGEASVSLRGVYEYGTVSGACSVPAWVVKKARARRRGEELKQVMKAATVGKFEAKILVENMPKYRQSGELCDMINEKAYLLVKVLRVDRVAIPDQRPISQCDTAVQVQFSGNSYETDVQQDSVSPQFNQEFYFELKTNNLSEFSPEELSAMHGPIIFDVWLRSDDEGALTAEHCGHVELFLSEIFSEGKPEVKTHTSIRTGSTIEYKTVVLKARRRLTCLWTHKVAGESAVNVPVSALLPSFLYVDIWLRPFDFSIAAGAASASMDSRTMAARSFISVKSGLEENVALVVSEGLLPAQVRGEWSARAKEWIRKANELKERFFAVQNRWFEFYGKSQNRQEHFLPLFLDVLRPPQQIANPHAIAFWIHCLPTTSMEELKAVSRFIFTPDFTLSLGKGDSFAHAILHCSMLRGLSDESFKPFRPFVCVGTGWNGEPLAWVMNMHSDGSVVFFDTAGHRQFELPRRVADVARCRRVVRGSREPAHALSQQVVGLEIKRRVRLEKQDAEIKKLEKFQLDLIDCDPDIFRAPEILKNFEPEIHRHALVYCSDIAPDALCYRCGAHPDRHVLHGYICNRKILHAQQQQECASDDHPMYLCMQCAERTKKDLPLDKDSNGCFSGKEVASSSIKFADMPVLPYKSIDVVFDQTNCWLNLQHFCPAAILYDLWNPLYWHPFTTALTSFRSFSLASRGFRKARSREYFDKIRVKILTRLKKSIESVRRNGNLPSFFQRDPLLIAHMERGMELCFKRELVYRSNLDGQPTSEKQQLDADWSLWKLQLYSKVPANHRFVGNSFLFSFTDAIEISRIVLERIDLLAFREVGTQLVVSSFTGKLPNSLKAAYVYVAVVYPLSETVAQKTSETRTQDSFQTRKETNAFSDEVIERNRIFVQRMQIFDNETEFLARMKMEFNKENKNSSSNNSSSGPVALKQTSSRAPLNADNAVKQSSVDFPVNFDGEDEPPIDEYQEELKNKEEKRPDSSSPLPSGMIASLFSEARAPANPQDQHSQFSPFGWIPPLPKMPDLPSSSAGAFFANIFSESPAERTPLAPRVNPATCVPLQEPTRVPLYKPPKDLTKKGPIVTPLSLASPLNPTEAELREIYKPYTVNKVVGHRQYLRHLPTGYAIPIPPQEPLQTAAQLGGEELVTRVRVTHAHTATVVKKKEPPRDLVYDFNMNGGPDPSRKRSSN